MPNQKTRSKKARRIKWHAFDIASKYLGVKWDHHPQTNYLDKLTGQVIFTCDNDEDEYSEDPAMNKKLKDRVKGCSERYLEIPCLSDWDDDENAVERRMEQFLRDNDIDFEWV